MGGYGSGWHWRYKRRRTTDEVPKLDVRWLTGKPFKGASYLIPMKGYTLALAGHKDGVSVSLNGYAMGFVTITQTGCHFGGARRWWTCTQCDGRAAVVYFRRGCWACRTCHNLAYKSQHERPLDRMLRKIKREASIRA